MGRGEVHTGFWWGDLRERCNLEDRAVDETIILRWVIKKRDGSVKLIYLFQDRDIWRAFGNSVMNFRVYKMRRNS